jgi:hypothetical protein
MIVATPTLSGQATNKGYVDGITGNTTGTYSPNLSAHYISSATSIISSTNLLDSVLYSAITNAGLSSNGSYVLDGAGHYISTATSIANATVLLDSAVYTNTTNIATLTALNLSTRVSNLETFETATTNTLSTLTGSTSSIHDVQLTTTAATAVLVMTPTSNANVKIDVFYRVVTASTPVTINVTYTDNGSNSQTITLLATSTQIVGNYYLFTFLNSIANSAVTLNVTAGTANQVYVSATMHQS